MFYKYVVICSACLILVQSRTLLDPENTNSENTLKFVHILFRHGDRTNIKIATYPNDPYRNETYWPYGQGQLTNKGKQREYQLGKSLRRRYNNLLGTMYTPDLIEALSSDVNRTKMSLQLALAGLFPPNKEQTWDNELLWQPIPYNYIPHNEDRIFLGFFCDKMRQVYKKLTRSPKYVQEFNQDPTLLSYLREHSGKNMTNYNEMFLLAIGLEVEQELGKVLPEWTKKIFPFPIKDLGVKFYADAVSTTQMRQASSGFLLKKIIDDTIAKLSGETRLNNTKMFLYSGHEINIAFMLGTLDIFKPHIPPYGSHIIFEIHNINGTDGIKIFYQNYETPEPQLMKLPACEQFCPLDKFITLVEEYLPKRDICATEHKKL